MWRHERRRFWCIMSKGRYIHAKGSNLLLIWEWCPEPSDLTLTPATVRFFSISTFETHTRVKRPVAVPDFNLQEMKISDGFVSPQTCRPSLEVVMPSCSSLCGFPPSRIMHTPLLPSPTPPIFTPKHPSISRVDTSLIYTSVSMKRYNS